ncbi:MAG: mannitol dehydrogenase family protein [Pseudomonadota bacterium]
MDELIPLKNETLPHMPETVKVPTYDRSALSAGIVHIGLGNFHRGHQAWYTHRLMEQGVGYDWAIVGAGVRPNDSKQRERLRAQDYLTTLIELDPSGKSAEVIGSMIDFVPVETDNAALIERIAQPDIRIVSLTVTEGGYYIDPATGEFDSGHADILHDAKNTRKPRTAFGAMIEALRLRRAAGVSPFTCLSCDNLQGNGAILRRTVVSLARLMDADLASWIERECTFPNSMVDCIVPATGEKELKLARSFGVDDQAPVTHENFRQWVIEDKFCAGRPPWEKADVTFSDNVHAFEAMKLRVLNGGHQMIAIPGELVGIETISGCMAHAGIRRFLRDTLTEEVLPNVRPVPGMTPASYLDLIDRRFSNPEIVDTTRRVAFDGSSRQPGFIVPSIRDALDNGQPVRGLALMSALWMRYCLGVREDGSIIEANDPNWSALHAKAHAAKPDPIQWLRQEQYYGHLVADTRFATAFSAAADMLQTSGVARALEVFADSHLTDA